MKIASIAWRLALAGFLLVATACVWRTTRRLEQLPTLLDARLATEADRTRQLAREEFVAIRVSLLEQLREATSMVDRHLSRIADMTQTEVGLTRAEALVQLEEIRGELTAVRQVVTESLECLNRLLNRTDRAVELLTPQALGLVAAAKVTAGETAQAMRTLEREMPAIVANVRETSANVTQITKPSRWYLRLARIVAPLLGGWLIGKAQ